MPQKAVVEPAGNEKYPEGKTVQRGEVTDTLLFPHVDSCLAIVFILEDGAVVGAHAAQFGGKDYGEFRPNENALEAVVEMKKLLGGKAVVDVFTLGDGNYIRSTFLSDVTSKPIIVNADTDGGFDITVDPAARTITAVSCRNGKSSAWKFSDLKSGPEFI